MSPDDTTTNANKHFATLFMDGQEKAQWFQNIHLNIHPQILLFSFINLVLNNNYQANLCNLYTIGHRLYKLYFQLFM